MLDPEAVSTRGPVGVSILDRAAVYTQGQEAACTQGQGAGFIPGQAVVCIQVQAAEFIRDHLEARTPTRVPGVRALPGVKGAEWTKQSCPR